MSSPSSNPTRRQFLAGISTVAASAAVTGLSASKGPKPNIVLFVADDLGYGDLSCYGQQHFRTPNIDRLGAEGIRFTEFYSGSTVCAPSRCSLMTGFHTGHGYVRGNAFAGSGIPLRPSDTTIPEVLKTAGYRTGMFGKWGLGENDTTGQPNRKGFDEWFGYLNQQHAHFYYTDYLYRNTEKVAIDKTSYSHDLMADAALDFIRKQKDGPFFLYLPFTIPHASLQVPEDSLKEYRGRFPETPYKGDHYTDQPEPNAAVAAMISRLDRDVGRVLRLLKELGLDKDTLVLFTSDNGPHKEGGRDPNFFRSSGPLRGIKRDLYEGGIRVPLVARWPGHIPTGKVSSHPWAFWDMLPTFADLARAKFPAGLDGLSQSPALLGRSCAVHEFLYWEFHEGRFAQAVRTGDWKGVRTNAGQPLELYDLKSDIGEQRNLAAERPDVVKKIEDYLISARTASEFWGPGSGKKLPS